MPERPLLIFPNPEPVPKPKGKGGGGGLTPPSDRTGQAQRIEKQFEQIQAAFVSDEPGDIERVLVMETSGRIDKLQNAVRKINGLEWLAEMDVDDIDLHDLYDEKDSKKIKGGRFYLLSSNKQAVDSLLRFWEQYQDGRKFDHGYGIFENIFKCLITLRRWDVRDRLRDTGILNTWKEEYQMKKGSNSDIEFEIELHYRRDKEKQSRNRKEITREIERAGGSIGRHICIDEIAFHALKAILPVASIGQVIQHSWDTTEHSINISPVFSSEEVRYFRPIGQHIDTEKELTEHSEKRAFSPIGNKPPVVALLDGAPVLRHEFLDDRIVLIDPDDYMEAYDPQKQRHGTAMASLICHGDLSRSQDEVKSLIRRIYVRPVMKPHPMLGEEMMPYEHFQEDIIERAVRDMFESDDLPVSDIKVINLSLGNIEQHYLYEMSPWAKLLDWLSFKYKVLFIVSAGNCSNEIGPVDNDGSSDELSRSVISKIDENQRNHRLLSPAESMNALTVGALQGDSSGELDDSVRGFDPINDNSLPAPYSRVGPGYHGVIKPEIFTQGGRGLYDRKPDDESFLEPVSNNELPGVKTAYPGTRPESLGNIVHRSGTSNAAAIASHGAGHIFEMLEELRGENEDMLFPDFDAVLIKTLIVHSASQGEGNQAYEHLKNNINSRKFPRYRSRFLGYGNIDIERVLECTQARATAIGCGYIEQAERHRFVFPLPAGSSIQDYLRLTVTLAWVSPINPFHVGFRRAKLFFESAELKGENGHRRQDADWQQVRKGTVQHEIFGLDKGSLSSDTLELFVECASDAGDLDDKIPYGLAVTLEIAEQESINLYQVIREKIKQKVPSDV